jgi:hypothetical protein
MIQTMNLFVDCQAALEERLRVVNTPVCMQDKTKAKKNYCRVRMIRTERALAD